MITSRNAALRSALLAAMLLLPGGVLCAQSLTIVVTAPPATLNVSTSQDTSGTTNMTVRSSWDLTGSYKNDWVTTCIYMTQSLRGAPSNTDTVPYADVHVTPLAGPNAGSTVSMTNQSSCVAAGALVIGNTKLTDQNSLDTTTRVHNGYRDDQTSLQVFNVGNLSPDTYTGTIFVVALVHI